MCGSNPAIFAHLMGIYGNLVVSPFHRCSKFSNFVWNKARMRNRSHGSDQKLDFPECCWLLLSKKHRRRRNKDSCVGQFQASPNPRGHGLHSLIFLSRTFTTEASKTKKSKIQRMGRIRIYLKNMSWKFQRLCAFGMDKIAILRWDIERHAGTRIRVEIVLQNKAGVRSGWDDPPIVVG